jgi:hypothetical protein
MIVPVAYVNCKEKNCKYRRKRKSAPYGRSSSKSPTWHCRCDGLASHENMDKVNSKRERRKAKKEIKDETST